jgi:hypothetical protein
MARALAAVVAFFLAVFLLASTLATAAPTSGIPAVFAFGDSTLDPGNNNGLATLVRADHAPYGCGFPGAAATGRFSDGKLITDYIVESLGVKDLLPAYRDSGLTVAEASTGQLRVGRVRPRRPDRAGRHGVHVRLADRRLPGPARQDRRAQGRRDRQ